MSEDRFVSKLSDVFRYVLQIKEHLPDDTCLQRLLDIIKLHVADNKLECSGLVDFIIQVTTKPDNIEPSVLTFCLLLCGNLGNSEEIYQKYEEVINNLLTSVQHLLNDSSVGTAYYTCISQLITHTTGLNYICKNQDNIKAALDRLKCGESIFLKSATRKFLKNFLTSPYSNLDHNIEVSHLEKVLINELECLVPDPTKPVSTSYLYRPKCILALFDELALVNYSGYGSKDQFRIIKCCLKLCLHASSDIFTPLFDVMKWCLITIKTEDINIFMEEAVREVKKLITTDLIQAHKIACYLSYLVCVYPVCTSDTVYFKELKSIIDLPIKILLGTGNTNVTLTKSNLTTLILQTLSCFTREEDMYELRDRTMMILRIIQGLSEDCLSIYKPYIINNNLLLHKVLHSLSQNLESRGMIDKSASPDLYNLLLGISSQTTDTMIFKSCMSCIMVLLSSCWFPQLNLSSLVNILEKKLCDLKWEVRDTALEFINKLIRIIDSNEDMLIKLSNLSWLCIDDGNGYVRASVITVLSSLTNNNNLLNRFIVSSNLTLSRVVDKLVTILKDDSEAFARRSAVITLQNLYEYCDNDCRQTVQTTMLHSMNDFDWEVKILVLDFWEKCFLSVFQKTIKEVATNSNSSMPEYANILSSTQKNHVPIVLSSDLSKAVLLGYNDYEPSVNDKASKMIRKLIKLWDSCPNTVKHESDFNSQIKRLKELDINNILINTDNEYSTNPISLLDDILATGEEKDEDNFVDCY